MVILSAVVMFKRLVTRDCFWSTKRTIPAFGGSLQWVRCSRLLPSEGVTTISALGAINRSGGRPWLVQSTLGT